MMDKPLVSIIVPIYMVEQYLDRCIQSIVAQSYLNWELILVDDGSPDQSGEICDDWKEKDSRILVFHKGNEGVSVARNYGLDRAKGKYIMFADSDDWYSHECVATCVEHMEKENLDLLQFNFYDAYSNGELKVSSTDSCSVCKLDNYVRTGIVGVCVWQGIYRKDIIDKYYIRFDNRMKYAEDGVFVCTVIYQSNRMMHLPDALYYYCKREDSVMHKKDFESYIDSMLLQIDFLDSHPVFQEMYRNLVTMNVGGICTLGLKKTQRKRLEEVWLRFRDNSPYVHLDEYNSSKSIEFVFIPLQKYSFTLAWFFTALTTKLYGFIRKR